MRNIFDPQSPPPTDGGPLSPELALSVPGVAEREQLQRLLGSSMVPSPQNGVPAAVFNALLIMRGALQIRHSVWTTSVRPAEIEWPALCSSRRGEAFGDCGWVLIIGNVIARVSLGESRTAYVSLAAVDAADLDGAEEVLVGMLPPDTTDEIADTSEIVTVTFWLCGNPSSTRRRLPVASWQDIRQNYAPQTRERLGALLERPSDRDSGKLILWHGAPGTGKTNAIRALTRAWRSWCDVHYVIDPEAFFGSETWYMREVLMDSSDYFQDTDTTDAEQPDGRWRLIVLEDTGELLGIDAKHDMGQGLSRLLNVVDGLLGQGLRILVLITTNEHLARLNPAVTRPGRCAALVEFESLDTDDANDWLIASGCSAAVASPQTLAELYSLRAGERPARSRTTIGFA